LWLIWVNREAILAVIDLSRFQREREIASSNTEQALATSDTQMAKFMRGAVSIAQESATKIQSIFGETEDPIMATALPASVSNVDASFALWSRHAGGIRDCRFQLGF